MNDDLKIKPHQDYYINNEEKWFDIPPHGVAEIPSGISIKCPDDAWVKIQPRSSTLWKRGLSVSIAVIDSGFTGKLFVLASNPNDETVRIHEFDRLAQIIIIPKYILPNNPIAVDTLPETERGITGFGSTGGFSGL